MRSRGALRLVAVAVLALLVTSCAGEDEEPQRPRATVNPALPAATALTDLATPVPSGEFGVVAPHSTGDTPPGSVPAIRIASPLMRITATDPAAFVYIDRTAYPDGDHAVRFAA
ncbi:hypothetical protein GCM10017786_02970 [Amycolatopsis deserti]|uniref:Uncharacterized protein n=1 Tax=Amycolatopsis deserti TaxID=185696 RepID=A0ABQ3IDM0_9PSEU|nr:hypothetical protein [Amycolatopsis deserti]GHE77081.1 hypothetical protein GCM10017786_02970 [Amycolatopsis deserti]